MAYRRPDPERAQATEAQQAARAELRALAADGEAAARALADAGAERKRRDRSAAERARLRRFARSCLHGARWHTPLILGSVLTLCGGGALLMALGGGGAWALGGGVALIFLGAGLPIAVIELMRGRLIAAERAQIAALPYRLAGYEAALSQEPHSGRLRLYLAFADEAPAYEVLAGLAGKLRGQVERADATSAVLVSDELSVDGGDGPDTNAAFYAWLRDARAEVLAPLHRAYPLRQVEIER